MKALEPITFDADACRAQLDDLRALLTAKVEFGEKADVQPLFYSRRQLAVLLGSLYLRQGMPNRYAHEFDLFGDFTCDLAVGH